MGNGFHNCDAMDRAFDVPRDGLIDDGVESFIVETPEVSPR